MIKAQLLGFKAFNLDPDPLDVTFETANARPLQADVKLDLDEDETAELAAGLRVNNVPATLEFALGDDGAYEYDASSRIGSIEVGASGLPEFPDVPAKLDTVHALVTGVPAHIDAGYADNGRITFKGTDDAGALDGVGSVEVTAATADAPALPTGLAASHAAFRQVDEKMSARVKVSGLREIDITPTPLDVVVDTDVLAALDLDAKVDQTTRLGRARFPGSDG